MEEVVFTTQNFNEEHWKAGPAAVGWKYDLNKDNPQILRIKESLRKIKNKLPKIENHIHRKNNFKDLSLLSIQKITEFQSVKVCRAFCPQIF